jgi:nicotinamidase/pyrazinamidase
MVNKKKITDIVIVGLATDYCVYNTVLDANNCGFVVHLILSCIRGIDNNSTKIALDHMKTLKGVILYDDVDDFYESNKEKFS